MGLKWVNMMQTERAQTGRCMLKVCCKDIEIMTVESLLNFNKTMTDTLGKYLFKLNNNDIRTTPTDFGGSTLLMVEQH